MEKRLVLELEQLRELGRLRERIPVERPRPQAIIRNGVELLDFASFDFLNLSNDPEVKRAAQKAIEMHGVGARSPRVGIGSTGVHLQAESRLAEFLGTRAGLLLSTFNQAILTFFAATLGEGDCIFGPDDITAPVRDAAHLVNAEYTGIVIGNGEALAQALQSSTHKKNRLVFIEAVSPVTGATCNLKAVATICAAHDVPLIVDQSFALGSIGLRGAGLLEELHLQGSCYAQVGDLAPGMGVFGGFLAGSETLIRYLFNRSRTLAAEAAIPVATAAATIASVDRAELLANRRTQLFTLAHRLRIELAGLGISPISDSNTPIVSVPFSNFQEARNFSDALLKQGVYVQPLLTGVHRSERSVVRILITSRHSERDLDSLLEALAQVKARVTN